MHLCRVKVWKTFVMGTSHGLSPSPSVESNGSASETGEWRSTEAIMIVIPPAPPSSTAPSRLLSDVGSFIDSISPENRDTLPDETHADSLFMADFWQMQREI